jgi:NADH:ubiquinone oxidoreductase subunit F (NADH-binding)
MRSRRAATELVDRFGRRGGEVLDRLRPGNTGAAAPASDVAAELDLPVAAVHGTSTFFTDLRPHAARHVRVCTGTGCLAALGEEPALRLVAALAAREGTSVQPVACVGYCYASPAALDGETPRAGGDLADQLAGRSPRPAPPIPVQAAVADPVLLARLCAGGEPWSVWPHVVAAVSPESVRAEVASAGLRGRGGAGFPTAHKWALVASGPQPRYVVANGDEGDPGSFVDRLLMESDPERVLEGLALAMHACGAEQGYVYVRSEYPVARDRLRAALAAAEAAGHLGPDVHGTGRRLTVRLVEGAGSYVAGEETALLRSMEGWRGAVSPRPPYPTESGLRGHPTAVNNVETLAAVPWIVERGGAAFARRGVPPETGTKLVGLSALFERPGVYEVDLGTPVRHVVEDLGGGLRGGHRLRALQVGGPLGGFLGPRELDVPLLDSALTDLGVALGHGSLVAVDERTPRELLRHVWAFVAAESCGTCLPCRIGSRRGLELAAREAGSRDPRHGELLDVLERGSLCAFGRAAPRAVRSLLRVYEDDLR